MAEGKLYEVTANDENLTVFFLYYYLSPRKAHVAAYSELLPWVVDDRARQRRRKKKRIMNVPRYRSTIHVAGDTLFRYACSNDRSVR